MYPVFTIYYFVFEYMYVVIHSNKFMFDNINTDNDKDLIEMHRTNVI